MDKSQVIENLNVTFVSLGLDVVVEDLRNFDTDQESIILDYTTNGAKYEIPLHGGEVIKRYITEAIIRGLRFSNGLDMLQANAKEYWEGLSILQTPFLRTENDLQVNTEPTEVVPTEVVPTEVVPTEVGPIEIDTVITEPTEVEQTVIEGFTIPNKKSKK
jgi:hypothetical protein